MLHARIDIAQVLDLFQVQAVIHEFAPGADPVVWKSVPLTLELPGEPESQDALSTVFDVIRLWSESTNHQ